MKHSSSKILTLTLSAFAILASATPAPTPQAQPQDCPAGSTLQCCQMVARADSPVVATLLGLLGVDLPDRNVIVGVHCSAVPPGPGCSAHPACCMYNNFGGLLSIDCTPI
ncbi:hydrophobin [Earliella scabrosa]|nr:hydrophobin [Earliella scabrosa]